MIGSFPGRFKLDRSALAKINILKIAKSDRGLSSIHISTTLDKVTAETRGTVPPGRRNHGLGNAAASTFRVGARHKGCVMKNRAMVTVAMLSMFIGACAIGFPHPSFAQNAIGGPTKPKQSAVGGAAIPAPVIGGAAKQSSIGVTKPNLVGGTANPITAGSAVKPNPPTLPPNKGGTVVTTSSTLKCAAGACVVRGAKP
jgi:hypothetical protein